MDNENESLTEMDELEQAFQKIREAYKRNGNTNCVNKWTKRINNSKNDNQLLNVLATGGVSNKSILAVQSRISKSSHKNRFASMAMKSSNAKPRSLANAIENNTRNKLTQSKK